MSFWEPERDRKALVRTRWTAGAAGIATILLVAVLGTVATNAEDCLARAGYTGDDPFSSLAPQECRNVSTATGLLAFVFLIYMVATAVFGIVVGIIAGRRRSAFNHGSTGAMVGLGFAVPWALAVYALAYGLGRLLPVSPSYLQQLRIDQHDQDVTRYTQDLCTHLLAGGSPTPLPVTDLAMSEPVFVDAPMATWRFVPPPGDYPRTALTSVGAPKYVGGVDIAYQYGKLAAHRAAEPMHASAWAPMGMSRVLLTPTATWCLLNGTWLTVEHRALVAVDVFADAVVLNAAPGHVVLLRSPYAEALAVQITWLRSGRSGVGDHPLFRRWAPSASAATPAAPRTPEPPSEPPSWAAFPQD